MHTLRLLFSLLILSLTVGCHTQSSPSESTEAPAAERRVIRTDKAPEPVGPYSQAIMVGNTLYLAGQIAINPENGEMVTATIEEETRQVMSNLQAVLEEAGMSMEDVVKTTIYMTDLNNFGKANEIYGSYFNDSPPARVTVGVAALPRGANLEITMEAVK
ncbi:MAG: RidA family protein [Cyclobacteriaceae bacterium]